MVPTVVKLVFMMQGEFVVTMTKDKKNNDFYLELYRFNQVKVLD